MTGARPQADRRQALIAGACAGALFALGPTRSSADRATPFIDAHAHIVRGATGRARRNAGREMEPDEVARDAIGLLDRLNVTLAILAPPPFPPNRGDRVYGLAELKELTRAHPGRFAFAAGGELLNPMIQETPPDRVTAGMLRRFEKEAERIAGSGAAGFGELAAEHFSSRLGHHPYESAPPDHPLFLALADIAAERGMPIELHMEAIPRDMPFPDAELAGPPNPTSVRENVTAFERLLGHNPRARIVWLHAGWDLSGERTVPLMLSLLREHANLFMSVKSDRAGSPRTGPFRPGGVELKPGWVAMLSAFPDRFVVGSDQFFDQPPQRIERARAFVDALPPELSPAIATGNAGRIYRLPGA